MDQQSTRRVGVDSRRSFDSARLNGSPGVTPFLKVTDRLLPCILRTFPLSFLLLPFLAFLIDFLGRLLFFALSSRDSSVTWLSLLPFLVLNDGRLILSTPPVNINTDTYTGASFTFRNRLLRFCWNFVQATAFRWSPRPLHRWRSALLRLFGAKLGRGVHIYGGARIWAPWNLEIGDETGVADGVTLYSQGRIVLGCRVVISQGAHLCAGTHDYEHPGFPLLTAPIRVGDHAWIAAEAFVHPGVTIGEGTVIGARSVVTKDMPRWTVCAGHPCKPLKQRRQIPRL